jgi:putative transposase
MERCHGKPERCSIRLKDYDYSAAGAYFVTICAHNRLPLFGSIAENGMALNEMGLMVERWWLELKNKFRSIEIDDYVIMPNHFHGIVAIVGADLRVRPDSGADKAAGLPRIVQWFKTMTTNEYIRNAKTNPDTSGLKLWQRNYYEHVIRNDKALEAVRDYIRRNPSQWSNDSDNPDRFASIKRYR